VIRRRKPDRERQPQDHSWRCSTCALNYWDPGTCRVCKGTLAAIAHQPPDPDIDYHVALMLGEPPEADDKVYGWRMRELVFAGAPLALAEAVADDRSIDLHRAIGIVRDAGPELAERILL
jgi:hypothetical protein